MNKYKYKVRARVTLPALFSLPVLTDAQGYLSRRQAGPVLQQLTPPRSRIFCAHLGDDEEV